MQNTVFNPMRWVGLSLGVSALLLTLFFLLTVQAKAAPTAPLAPNLAAQEAEVNFSQAAYTVTEDQGVGLVFLEISPVISAPISLIVSSANIQAEAAKDFVGFRQSLVIHPHTAIYTLTVTILDDHFVEGNEQFRLTISPLNGATVGPIAETIITIIENDVAYLGIADVEVSERAGNVAMIITQSITSTLESLVDVRTMDGSATSPADYEEIFTTVSIPPGSLETTLWIPIYDNDHRQGAKNFTVILADAIHAQIAVPTATVTLLDDEMLPILTPHPAEATAESDQLTFDVTLSESWSHTVTVAYTTYDGSAIAAQDYLSQTGVLTLPPGMITTTVTIALLKQAIVGDQLVEPTKNFYLIFYNPIQAILSRTEVEGLIRGQADSAMLFLPALAR